jgi:hypothetical protein
MRSCGTTVSDRLAEPSVCIARPRAHPPQDTGVDGSTPVLMSLETAGLAAKHAVQSKNLPRLSCCSCGRVSHSPQWPHSRAGAHLDEPLGVAAVVVAHVGGAEPVVHDILDDVADGKPGLRSQWASMLSTPACHASVHGFSARQHAVRCASAQVQGQVVHSTLECAVGCAVSTQSVVAHVRVVAVRVYHRLLA